MSTEFELKPSMWVLKAYQSCSIVVLWKSVRNVAFSIVVQLLWSNFLRQLDVVIKMVDDVSSPNDEDWSRNSNDVSDDNDVKMIDWKWRISDDVHDDYSMISMHLLCLLMSHWNLLTKHLHCDVMVQYYCLEDVSNLYSMYVRFVVMIRAVEWHSNVDDNLIEIEVFQLICPKERTINQSINQSSLVSCILYQ